MPTSSPSLFGPALISTFRGRTAASQFRVPPLAPWWMLLSTPATAQVFLAIGATARSGGNDVTLYLKAALSGRCSSSPSANVR